MERTLQHLTELLLDVVFLVKESGEIVFVNRACISTLGFEPSEMIGANVRDFMHPDDISLTLMEMAEIVNGRLGFGFENRYLHKDGTTVHLQWTAQWLPQYQLRIGVARDISERVHAEQRQATLLELSIAAHNADSLHAIFSSFNSILRQALPLKALAVALEPGDRLVYFSDEHGCPGVTESHVIPLLGRGVVLGEFRLYLNSNIELPAPELELLQFAASQAAAAIERFNLQEELIRAAQYDELTGLPNRRLLQDRMQSALARARRGALCGAMLFIDLNNFKRVNDIHGHATGDRLLYEVAQRISSCVREVDTVARLGGDEFVALLEDVATKDQAQAVAKKIMDAIALVMDIDGVRLNTSASIGVVFYPQQGDSIDQLMRQADSAMYASKKIGKVERDQQSNVFE